jgi:hypothetical protein
VKHSGKQLSDTILLPPVSSILEYENVDKNDLKYAPVGVKT